MALPFIIGGVIAAATAVAGKKAYDGYQDNDRAESISNRAKRDYERAKNSVENSQNLLNNKNKELEEYKSSLAEKFKTFKEMADELLKKLELADRHHRKIEINIPPRKIKQISAFSMSATGFSMGIASTMLLGGFGSLVTTPLMAVMAWSYASNAEKNLEKARKMRDEVEEIEKKCKKIVHKLDDVRSYIDSVYNTISEINNHFNDYYNYIKKVYDLVFVQRISDQEIQQLSEEITSKVNNGYGIAACITDIVITPLFKLNENNEIATDSDNIPLENKAKMNEVINTQTVLFRQFC